MRPDECRVAAHYAARRGVRGPPWSGMCKKAVGQARRPFAARAAERPRNRLERRTTMLKAAIWVVVIIFVIGLLVVMGVLDLIF